MSRMLNICFSSLRTAACVTAATLLLACSPKYDWREVRGAGAPFMIMLPAKPSSHARPIDLAGTRVTMTMTAAEVDDVTFAVGTAELPDAAQAQTALAAMKVALVRNIGGTVRYDKPVAPAMTEIEAGGAPSGQRGEQPWLLLARFMVKDKRVYQIVVVGREKDVSREAADTFLTSFKPG